MRILYTSSEGAEFDFSTLKDAPSPRLTRIKTADFHKWEYVPDGVAMQYGVNVARYTRDAARYETQLYVYGTPEEREEFLEEFHNAIMHDVTMNTPGVLTWGDWQINAVVIASDTYPHEDIEHITVNDLTFYCPNPRWVLPEKFHFDMDVIDEEIPATWSNEFPLDFQIKNRAMYAPANFIPPRNTGERFITISHHVPSDFTLRIYGPIQTPIITIGGHKYGINYYIPGKTYAEIDSRYHTVMLSNGTNLFNYRLFQESVFQKIGYGKIEIAPETSCAFDLTIYKESDEPRWNLYSQI